MANEGTRKRNPFNPTAPSSPEYFAGRFREIDFIVRALNQTRHGSQQNVLLTGERGIGKSSLALLARYIAQEPRSGWGTDCRFVCAYYTLDENDRISDVCYGTVEKLNRSIEVGLADRFFEKLRRWDCSIKLDFWFGSTEVAAKKPQDEDPAKVRRDYVKVLEALWDELSPAGCNGLLIIVDELHKIRSEENLGAFFKKISEELVNDGYRNVMLFAVGLPWLEQKIVKDDPSAVRVFEHVALGPMSSDESIAVIDKGLSGTAVTIEHDAMERLVHWSGGYPYFLQQMCFDAFEADEDGNIDLKDASRGVGGRSLVQFDRMFFGRVLREAEGKNYQKIIDTLAHNAEPNGMRFPDLKTKSRVKGVGQYLPKLAKDGVITSPKRGRYKLSSEAFALHVRVQRILETEQLEKGSRLLPSPPGPQGCPNESCLSSSFLKQCRRKHLRRAKTSSFPHSCSIACRGRYHGRSFVEPVWALSIVSLALSTRFPIEVSAVGRYGVAVPLTLR